MEKINPLTREDIKKKSYSCKRGRPIKLEKTKVYEIRKLYKKWIDDEDGRGYRELAEMFGVTIGTIHKVILGKGTYKNI